MKSTFCLILLLLFSGFVLAQENLVVRKVKFSGNSQINQFQLKDNITMESTNWFKRKILKKEPVYFTNQLYLDDTRRLRVFYQKEGYLKVQFPNPEVIVNKKNKVKIIFHINEGNPVTISEVNYQVDSTLSIRDALPGRQRKNISLQSQAGEDKVFRDEAIVADKLLIADEFYDVGYPYTIVNHNMKVDTTANTASVLWDIKRGPLTYFGSTNVNGNNRIPDRTIRRQLAYDEGDIWSKKKIDISQDHIYNQGNYRVASVRTLMEKEQKDTLDMLVHIGEAPRWTTRFGVGYGREDKFRAYTDIQYLGFLTNTGRLNLYAKHSGLEPYNVYLKFAQPSFIFPINTLVLHPFILSQDEPGYELTSTGFNITFQQNFSKDFNTSIGLIYEDVEVDSTEAATAPQELSEEYLYKKSGIVVGGIYSNAEPVLDPVQGYAISANIKTNDILWGNDMPFFRILAEYKTYIGVKNGVVLALKIKGGGIKRTDDKTFIPVEEKFFAGGSYSVRGWSRSDLGPKDENGTPIGGNSLLEGSAEFRIDLGKRFKMAFFLDAGNVWEESFKYDIKDLHYAAGAGLRIKTAIGPAGIDLARPVFEENLGWQIHFNIGHTF